MIGAGCAAAAVLLLWSGLAKLGRPAATAHVLAELSGGPAGGHGLPDDHGPAERPGRTRPGGELVVIVLVILQGVLLVVLTVLVAGLLRAHGAVLRRLHQLDGGASFSPETRDFAVRP